MNIATAKLLMMVMPFSTGTVAAWLRLQICHSSAEKHWETYSEPSTEPNKPV